MITTIWRVFIYLCEIYSYYHALVLVGDAAGKLYECVIDAYHDRHGRRLKRWVRKNFDGDEREEVLAFMKQVWWID